MNRRNLAPKIIGGTIGLALAGWFLIYQPMKQNYDECGRVTLCSQDGRE